MKSPISGKEMSLQCKRVTAVFRKEEFEVTHVYYLCEESGEEYESEEMVDVNLNQVYNAYRAKFNLPFPEEIKAIRERFQQPANKMAEILGFGINVYRGYESGEVPSGSNARLIQVASDPKEFKKLLLLSGVYTGSELDKQVEILDKIIAEDSRVEIWDFNRFMVGEQKADIYTGYRLPSLEKFNQMVAFFAETLQPWKTKLNKLLFYADFLHFKRTSYSISGMRYQAIQMGPVPLKFNTLFDEAVTQEYADVLITSYTGGGVGEQFKPGKKPFDSSLFTESEWSALQSVANTFKKVSTQKIIDLSHEEEAWNNNIEGHHIISYEYSFTLKHV